MVTRSGAALSPPSVAPHPGRRARRRERRRLARQDRLVAHLAELRRIGELVIDARAVVADGWTQGRWLVDGDGDGAGPRACLVGAVVQAGGGTGAPDPQPVARTLDLTWHALHRDPQEPVRWCPAPPVRLQHVRDLARWNDAAGRTSDEVVALLDAVGRLLAAETDRARAAAGVSPVRRT